MHMGTVVAVFALVLAAYFQPVTTYWSELDILAVHPLNVTDNRPIKFDVRTKRIRKGFIGISGSIEMLDTFHAYTGEMIAMHSSMRNNDFKLIPFQLPEGPSCDKANNDYRKYIMKDLRQISNFPYSEDSTVDMCAMFTKGSIFTLSKYEVDQNLVPKFLLPGHYKVQLRFKKAGVVVGGLEALVDFS